jgi:hypothetical protein
MTRSLVALVCLAILAGPTAASAQPRWGGHGVFHGPYHGWGGWGGYRPYYGGYYGYRPYYGGYYGHGWYGAPFWGFGLGLALGSGLGYAWSAPAYPYYYPPPAYYAPPPPAYACGQWIWRPDIHNYEWHPC